jgi:serine/threonine-protein kinase
VRISEFAQEKDAIDQSVETLPKEIANAGCSRKLRRPKPSVPSSCSLWQLPFPPVRLQLRQATGTRGAAHGIVAAGLVKVDTNSSHVAVALSSAAEDTDGTRAVLQERVGLWTKWSCLLSSGFYLANLLTWPFTMPADHSVSRMVVEAGPVLHFLASLLLGATWFVARHVRLSTRALHILDTATLIAACAIYTVMGIDFTSIQRQLAMPEIVGILSGLLASANCVLARAIAVPSTGQRTFWVSAAAMLPLVPATFFETGDAGAVVNTMCWCGVTIAIATAGSGVIFGLRREADRVRRLGQYTLEQKIGAGGMGVVYRASHAMLRRPTAIKLLPPDRAGEVNLRRFESEVQLTAQLSHPNTVAIYDYGRTPDGIFYYAMEYLDGINLEDLVRRDGPIPGGRAIRILTQVAGALAEAHERGLLHRDIKPANIILTERGGEPDVAKVVDFGLVKRLNPDGASATMTSAIVLTGTPLYMSPEALTTPDTVDARSDLYALGAVGYFLLTGKPVFEANSMAEAFGHHLHTPPVPPSQRTTNMIPVELERLILACLSKQVDQRPQSARVLHHELVQLGATWAWTMDDAEKWWRGFRASDFQPTVDTPGTPSQAVTMAPDALTVSVDLAGRN